MNTTRDDKLLQSAIDGLREYYPELEDEDTAKAVKSHVSVPSTGNDQKDYENVRDQVEARVQDIIIDGRVVGRL